MQEEDLIQPITIQNEFGQKVRCYDWKYYQRKMNLRKPLREDTDLSGKRLVIKHTWGIGDIFYMTAALYALKKKFPTCKLTVITTYPDVLEHNPAVDQILHYMDSPSIVDLAESIKEDWYWLDYDTPLKGGYDYKIHLRTKPALNEFLVKLLKETPDDLSDDERDFVNQASTSVISRYKMVALDMYCWHAHIKEPDANRTIHYYPQDYELEMAKRFLAPIKENGFKIITLMPHSSTIYKDYPHWKKVINLCPPNYFWLVLNNFPRVGETWAGPNIFDASGAFKIRQSAALVIEGDLNCSSDTGLLYPRAARGGPCVVTYGPHEPEPFLHYFPSAYGMRIDHIRETKGMEGMCSVGCYIDQTSCHKGGEFAPCLWELSPQKVADKIQELIG